MYCVYPAHFLSAPGSAWQAAWKKIKVKLGLLAKIYVLLRVGKDIRGGICYAIHWYAKTNNKHTKDCDKSIIISSVLGSK